jgi:hypothetical protein
MKIPMDDNTGKFEIALDREMDRRLDEHLRDSEPEDSVVVDWNFIDEPIPYLPTGKGDK